ncbi:nuclear transport factor 2 family protein [Kitasatospora sp. NPDC006697]|uniref:nuclear transport factor 2 family protein n=1 Tax=Kitasatospora sp. NPDC006697 TaxID=3364020 RepID=UPI0036948052
MAAGPREIFELFRANLLAGEPALADEHWAADAVVEFPYAHEGRPQRASGAAGLWAFATAARPAPVEEFRVRALHGTADPEVLIADYELAGGGQRAVSVLMLRVRGGLVRHWREYQDVAVPA